jgi:hypothetical protein
MADECNVAGGWGAGLTGITDEYNGPGGDLRQMHGPLWFEFFLPLPVLAVSPGPSIIGRINKYIQMHSIIDDKRNKFTIIYFITHIIKQNKFMTRKTSLMTI